MRSYSFGRFETFHSLQLCAIIFINMSYQCLIGRRGMREAALSEDLPDERQSREQPGLRKRREARIENSDSWEHA